MLGCGVHVTLSASDAVARRGPSKSADPSDAGGRLREARDFKRDAEELHALRRDSDNANGVITLIVHAAIAYADALTARYGGFINQKDHRAVVRALEISLGKRASAQQLEHLRRILDEKDAASYGVRFGRHERAQKLLDRLERFALWAEQQLKM